MALWGWGQGGCVHLISVPFRKEETAFKEEKEAEKVHQGSAVVTFFSEVGIINYKVMFLSLLYEI